MPHFDHDLSALEAIRISETQDRIVHLWHSAILWDDLSEASEGCAETREENGTIYELWGEGWRVHLHASSIADDEIEKLAEEAASHDDRVMLEMCRLALAGNDRCRARCFEAIDHACAMQD